MLLGGVWEAEAASSEARAMYFAFPRRPAVGNGCQGDINARLIFVHGAGRGVDAEADGPPNMTLPAVIISVSEASTPTLSV
jgi:hypothetical protein